MCIIGVAVLLASGIATAQEYKPTYPLVLTSTKGYYQADIRNIALLGSRQRVEWHVTENGISIDGRAEMKGNHVWVFRIERHTNKEFRLSNGPKQKF